MKLVIKWGIVLGVAVCGWTLVLHALGFYTTNLAAGQRADVIATVIPVATIALALRARRRELAVGLSVWESLRTGVAVGLVSVPITAGFLWWYHHVLNPAWLDLLIAWQRDTMSAAGATVDAIKQAEAVQRSGGTDRAQLLGAFIGTTLISAVIALVAGLFFRRAPSRA